MQAEILLSIADRTPDPDLRHASRHKWGEDYVIARGGRHRPRRAPLRLHHGDPRPALPGDRLFRRRRVQGLHIPQVRRRPPGVRARNGRGLGFGGDPDKRFTFPRFDPRLRVPAPLRVRADRAVTPGALAWSIGRRRRERGGVRVGQSRRHRAWLHPWPSSEGERDITLPASLEQHGELCADACWRSPPAARPGRRMVAAPLFDQENDLEGLRRGDWRCCAIPPSWPRGRSRERGRPRGAPGRVAQARRRDRRSLEPRSRPRRRAFTAWYIRSGGKAELRGRGRLLQRFAWARLLVLGGGRARQAVGRAAARIRRLAPGPAGRGRAGRSPRPRPRSGSRLYLLGGVARKDRPGAGSRFAGGAGPARGRVLQGAGRATHRRPRAGGAGRPARVALDLVASPPSRPAATR